MAGRDRSPVHVPLRTSSRTNLRESAMESNEDSNFVDRRTSKAHRILGTNVPISIGPGGWDKPQKPHRQSVRTPDSTSKQQNTGLAPFPAAGDPPHQKLRVRASSPLLGVEYKSQSPAPRLPKPSKKVRETGSSSNLFSYFTSKDSSLKSTPTTPNNHSLQPRVRNALQAEPQVTYTQSHNSPKESKRKLRPSRIDLSILFPKPRNTAPQNPLLSPQRMTNSPSPVSTVVSRRGSTSAAQKLLGDPLPERSAGTQNEASKPNGDRADLLSIPESEAKDGEWSPRSFEPALERTVGTSEIDLALDRYAGRRSLFSRSSVYSREQLRPEPTRPAETIAQRRAQSPSANRLPELYLAPSTKAEADRNRSRTNSNTQSTKTTVTKKSSKSTLKHKDLQNTSVLCLSSSEDEDSDQETPPTEQRDNSHNVRDSVATYGEFEPEIYTASTTHTGTVATPTLKKFERTPSTNSRGAHSVSQRQAPGHIHTTSSASKSSATTRQTNQSHRSGHIPAITEPDRLDQFPQPRLRTRQELKEMNRRSRVIAVTRQEQDLLEAMRQRKGKITPSIFNYSHGNGTDSNRNSVVPDVPDVPDQASVLTGPSRDSFCGSDTSFLRLSAAFPPFHARTEQGATQTDKTGSPSQRSTCDTEQKSGNSLASPQFSMVYSESIPSPATSGASPVTPTLPLHRLPSPKPPPRGPPPAIPGDQKQHARRRTDSSEAIMLSEGGDAPRKQDPPAWSFDFDLNHDRTSVAAVH